MHGSKTKTPSTERPGADPVVAGSAAGVDGQACRLAAEFSAPVALFDPRLGGRVAIAGAPEGAFPGPDLGLIAAASAHGKAVVWRGEGAGQVVWLLVPLPSPSGPLVAAVGFATAPEMSTTPGPACIRWGPVCPEPALRAWGQAVADQLRGAADRVPAPPGQELSGSALAPGPARPQPEVGERQIVARLIRRLRISDPPERFQVMAANALRTAMGVQAVAWVPCHHSEPVVASGEVGRLKGDGYRTLIPGPHHKAPTLLVNDRVMSVEPELRRSVAAAADSQGTVGWLIALNTTDDRDFSAADTQLLQPVASMIASQQVNARVYADLKELLFGVIRALTAAIDAKDPYTSGHSERVARIAVRLAEELGMSPIQRGDLYLTGLLHDVGKIGVDDAVLKKPGPLTPEEYRQIQAHVEIGVHILADLKKLNHLLPGVRHHHESLDGTGYPCGLAADAIPWEARILAVADSYDAMSSTRPYRRRLTPSQIDEILRKGSGLQWDSKVIAALFACRMDLELIRQKGLGESLQLAVSETLGRS